MKNFNPEQKLHEARREFGEHGGVTPSIERSCTFTVMDPKTMTDIFNGKKGPMQGCFLYGRHFNPTVEILDRYLAAMEGTEAAISTASGMSAINCAVSQICHKDDHLISSDTIYGGTHALFEDIYPNMGIKTTFVDITNLDVVKKAITPKTKVIYTEVVANPTLKIANIPELAKMVKEHNIQLIVDNTFTPMMISPIQLGADVVVYSMTKYINGASDIIAGAICGKKDFINQLMDLHTGRVMLFGPTMDPRMAFDIIQRLPHLGLRMREHSRCAQKVAECLELLNVKVIYPGLPTHPHYELFKSMLNENFGFGGIIAVDCVSSKKAQEFLLKLQHDKHFGLIAVSLGYFDTLMSCSGSSTSSEISEEEQHKIGLSEGLVRISVGFTGDLNKHLQQLEEAVKEVL